MFECCLVVVCFCLLHDTNLGPTLPAGRASLRFFCCTAAACCNAGGQGARITRRTTQSCCRAVFIPPEAKPWPFRARATKTTSSWSSLGLICPHVSSEITVEVILCKYSRQRKPVHRGALAQLYACPAVCGRLGAPLLGRSPHKNCKNDLDDQTWQELK